MRIFRILFCSLIVVVLTGCGTQKVVPENFPFEFKDNNPHQLANAKKYGIEPLEDRSQLKKVRRKLRLIEDCDYYAIDPLTHSVPYLTPKAAKLLKKIGKGFQKKLRKHKMGEYKIIVTSVLRTKDDVQKLMKTNKNAVANSAHCHATTFDITYRRYKYMSGPKANTAQLKYLLGETVNDLRSDGKCLVRYETNQTCLHITSTK